MKGNREKNIKNILESAKNIAIFWHIYPDGDAIWSMIWLGLLLKKQKKNISYFTPSEPSKIFDFLPKTKQIKTSFDYWNYDAIVFVDFSNIKRIPMITEKETEYFKKRNLIIIDHHEIDTNDSKNRIIDSNVSSTCELVFENTYQRRPHLYDKEIATYLLMGLMTDTWWFMHCKDDKRTIENALNLIKLWADKTAITNNIFRKRSLNSVLFTQKILKKLKTAWNLLYVGYKESDYKKMGLDGGEASNGLNEIMSSIEWYKASLRLTQLENKMIKWSLRSKWNINVAEIAKKLWWWWHKNAAWFSFTPKWNSKDETKKIVQKISKMLK